MYHPTHTHNSQGIAEWTPEDKARGPVTFYSGTVCVATGWFPYHNTHLPTTNTPGELFDMTLFNLFGVHMGFAEPVLTKVKAQSDCLLFKWPVKALLEMATGMCSGYTDVYLSQNTCQPP